MYSPSDTTGLDIRFLRPVHGGTLLDGNCSKQKLKGKENALMPLVGIDLPTTRLVVSVLVKLATSHPHSTYIFFTIMFPHYNFMIVRTLLLSF